MEKFKSIDAIKNTAILSYVADLPAQVRLIRMYNEVMSRAWDNMKDQGGTHLISGVVFSTTKSDAIRDYIEKISRIVFDSTGGWQRGFSATRIAEQHGEVGRVVGGLASKQLTHKDLFSEILIKLFGYDSYLVNAALESDPELASRYAVNYISNRFDLVAVDFKNPVISDIFDGFYPTNLINEIEKDPIGIANTGMEKIEQDSFNFFRGLLTRIKPLESK